MLEKGAQVTSYTWNYEDTIDWWPETTGKKGLENSRLISMYDLEEDTDNWIHISPVVQISCGWSYYIYYI